MFYSPAEECQEATLFYSPAEECQEATLFYSPADESLSKLGSGETLLSAMSLLGCIIEESGEVTVISTIPYKECSAGDKDILITQGQFPAILLWE